MRRRNEGFLTELLQVTATLPWWVCVALAVVTFFVLHFFASANMAAPVSPHGMGEYVSKQLVKTFAFYGQYLVPLFLVFASLVSGWSRRSVTNDQDSSRTPSPSVATSHGIKREPTMSETHLYALYKSTPQTAFEERPKVWGIELLRSIDWKRFEEVCAE